ncbi:MATE family efflux transporter [Breznakiellaceae bacterium SP9]
MESLDTDNTTTKFEAMTTQPVEKLVCKLAVPSIIIMLVSALYNMADTYFVGALGTNATAGVGLTFSLMAIIQAVGFFFGHGSGNYISRALGAQNNADAAKMAATGFFSAFIFGTLIAILGTVFTKEFARILGATETSLEYTIEYMSCILIGAPFMVSSLMLNNLLRFQGSAFFGMIGMTSGAVVNIALDPLFIFVYHLGVFGASLATCLSQILSCTLLFVVSCKSAQNLTIRPRNFSPSRTRYKEMLRGGSPSLLRQSLLSLSTIILNNAAGGFGDAAIAAMSIVNRVFMMGSSVLLGLGQGFQPVCGFNYGAKLYGRVKKAFWFCVKISSALLTLAAIVCFIFAPDLIALFRRDDPAVIAIGSFALRVQCFTFPLGGWLIVNNMMMQTIGRALPANILAFSRQGLFLIPVILIAVPALGIVGLQICIPIADFLTFLLAVPLGIHVLRKDLVEA